MLMKDQRQLNHISFTKNRYDFYVNSFKTIFERNRNLIFLCLIATFVWGLVAHSYMFFNGSFSHDSLNEFNAEIFGNDWKIKLGRVFVPAYRFLVRDFITLPWLIGFLSLLYISTAVFLTVKIFDIKSKVMTVLVAGIFSVNITVISATATYINDLDCNMLALAMSVLAVYLWKKYDKGFLYGMIPLCLSMGIYQAYISVTITLIMLYLIMQLLDGEQFGCAFKKGMKGVGLILGAGVLYFLSIKVIPYISGVPLNTADYDSITSENYNSVDVVLSMSLPEIISTVIDGYRVTSYKLLLAASPYPKTVMFAIYVIMIAIAGVIILLRIFQKEIKIKEKILTIFLIVLLPIGMNAVYALTGGMSHDLMHYAIWLVYLFVLLVAWWAVENGKVLKPSLQVGQRFVLVCLVFVVLWGNVQSANAAYLKKDLEQQANLSLFTRIVYQMESYDEYVAGETRVVFVGNSSKLFEPIPGFEHARDILGCRSSSMVAMAERNRYRAYFDYILMIPAVMADDEIWAQMQEDDRTTAMPCYPLDGSIKMIDGIMVVKMGE